MPCFAQVPVAGEDSEPDTEEAQHGHGGKEGDDQAGDQGALNIRHSVTSSDQGSDDDKPVIWGWGWCRRPPAQWGSQQLAVEADWQPARAGTDTWDMTSETRTDNMTTWCDKRPRPWAWSPGWCWGCSRQTQRERRWCHGQPAQRYGAPGTPDPPLWSWAAGELLMQSPKITVLIGIIVWGLITNHNAIGSDLQIIHQTCDQCLLLDDDTLTHGLTLRLRRRGIISRLWSLSVTWTRITGTRHRHERPSPRRETRRAPASQEHILTLSSYLPAVSHNWIVSLWPCSAHQWLGLAAW